MRSRVRQPRRPRTHQCSSRQACPPGRKMSVPALGIRDIRTARTGGFTQSVSVQDKSRLSDRSGSSNFQTRFRLFPCDTPYGGPSLVLYRIHYGTFLRHFFLIINIRSHEHMLFPEISTGSGLRSVMGTSFSLHMILILVQLGQVLMAYIFIFVRVEKRKPNVFVIFRDSASGASLCEWVRWLLVFCTYFFGLRLMHLPLIPFVHNIA